MPTYEVAPQIIHDRINRVMAAHHEELHAAKCDVRALMAFAKKAGEDAVKLHGYKCAATIKKVGIKERAQGLPDALILIDGGFWEKATDTQRDALIDHELSHLELDLDKDNKVKKDSLDRPMFTMRLHDWQLGGFAAISERYGEDALEVEQVRIAVETWGQLFWNFRGSEGLGKRKGKSARKPAGKPARKPASPAASVVDHLMDQATKTIEGQPADPAIRKSLEKLCPTKKGESITLSAAGRSVTLTKETRDSLRLGQPGAGESRRAIG